MTQDKKKTTHRNILILHVYSSAYRNCQRFIKNHLIYLKKIVFRNEKGFHFTDDNHADIKYSHARIYKGMGVRPPPPKNKNLLNLHCKIIAKMPRTPPPPDKHNYPSEPQPLEKFSESAHNSCSELITRVHHLI